MPEVVDPERSGFIIRLVDEAVAALDKVEALDRRKVRSTFEKKITVERMAQDYLAIYRGLSGMHTEAAGMHRLHSDGISLQVGCLTE